MDGFGAVTIHEVNVKNATEILSKGSKNQILHLFEAYNKIAAQTGVAPISMYDVQQIISSRGLKGFGIDWSAIGSVASQIGSGLATAAQAVGPLVIQKYQIDKLPTMTPATPVAVTKAATPGPVVGGGTDWTMIAMYGGGALVIGGLAYFMLSGKKKKV